jgi:hypothetical protein
VKLLSSKTRKVTAGLVVLLLLCLLRPGASRLKSRIITSVSSSLGRNVDIGSVHIQLLPRPGFDLENLAVYDDPVFGAEPLLRANQVSAAIRLTSLLRGRLEIARLDLTEPSLNLVHSDSGRWNVEGLLERTARMPLAPTGKRKSEPRPAFPYIEATSARINFKTGLEKKPYALTNADFSLWQDSENSWGVRLRAQPFRSDLNLNDTGLLQVAGTWQRAPTLRDTPLQLNLEWSRAQLGQLTKFFSGNDQGWRGGAQLDVTLTGTPAQLHVVSDANVLDYRRYDITRGEPLRLAVHCDGLYGSSDHAFHELVCIAPVGNGMVTLKGDVGVPGVHQVGLMLSAENVPAQAVVALVQRMKKNPPEDLITEGTVHGSVLIEEDASAGVTLRVEGRGAITGLRFFSTASQAEIGPTNVPFVLTADQTEGGRVRNPRQNASAVLLDGPRIEFGPIPAGIGREAPRETPVVAQGWINWNGYELSVTGDADIAKSLRTAHMFGLPASSANVEGAAQIDLRVGGTSRYSASAALSGPLITGTAKLRNVRVAVRGVAAPIEVSSADLQLLPDGVRVTKLNAKAAGTSWTGSLQMPRGCGTPGACVAHFNLNAGQIVLGDLSEWARPRQKEQPWYRTLTTSAPAGTSVLASLRASGRILADRFQDHNFTASHVAANVSLDSGKLTISELTADMLGGKHKGEWQADFSTKPGTCKGSGTVTDISLAQLGDATKDRWMSGVATASYEVQGPCPAEFWALAEGTLRFDVRDAALPHVALEPESPLRFAHWAGTAHLRDGKFEVKDAMLDAGDGTYHLNGTASLTRELEFKLTPVPLGSRVAYTITGTLAQPQVSPVPGGEQARLKTIK